MIPVPGYKGSVSVDGTWRGAIPQKPWDYAYHSKIAWFNLDPGFSWKDRPLTVTGKRLDGPAPRFNREQPVASTVRQDTPPAACQVTLPSDGTFLPPSSSLAQWAGMGNQLLFGSEKLWTVLPAGLARDSPLPSICQPCRSCQDSYRNEHPTPAHERGTKTTCHQPLE
jgi:hypothetical protein